MSLIPRDEQRGDGPVESRPDQADAPLVHRLLAALKAVLLALPGASEPAPESTEEASLPGGREPPAMLPSGREREDAEIVSTETGDRLVVEVIDNPDTSISSDTWEPVKR